MGIQPRRLIFVHALDEFTQFPFILVSVRKVGKLKATFLRFLCSQVLGTEMYPTIRCSHVVLAGETEVEAIL